MYINYAACNRQGHELALHGHGLMRQSRRPFFNTHPVLTCDTSTRSSTTDPSALPAREMSHPHCPHSPAQASARPLPATRHLKRARDSDCMEHVCECFLSAGAKAFCVERGKKLQEQARVCMVTVHESLGCQDRQNEKEASLLWQKQSRACSRRFRTPKSRTTSCKTLPGF